MTLVAKPATHVSLRLRFIAVIVAVMFVIFALLAYILIRNSQASLTSDLNKSSVAFAQLATRPIGDAYTAYQGYGSARVEQEVRKFIALNLSVSDVSIVDVADSQLFNLQGNAPLPSPTAAASFDPTYTKGSGGAYTSIVQPYIDTNGQHQLAVHYTFSTAGLDATIRLQFETIILLSLLGLAAAGSVTYWLINRLFVRPLESVSRAALAISQGAYSEQIGASRHDEIGDLARSVNEMATTLKSDIYKLQEVDKLKNEFIMISSHNLRTPLTVINGNIELLQLSKLPKDARSAVAAIAGGSKRLASFSEDMLTIATIEDGKSRVVTEPVTLKSLLSGIHDRYMDEAAGHHLTLDWQVDDPDALVNVSSLHIRSVLRNLLDNACKFTREGGTVTFHAATKTADLVVEIADTGIGIAPDEMTKLFTKFHRGTSTYTYDYEGTGIGLYATKLIVQAHHGQVTAASTLGKGSAFTVCLPGVVVAPPAPSAQEVSAS
jgi:signal transduction histidine kinase